MFAWFRVLLVRWGLLAPPPALDAASALAELRASKLQPAEEEDWASMVRRFRTQVFSAEDQGRVWRRYRRKYGGKLQDWADLREPNTEDQACLKQILDELAR